jgi:hypothetical protein
VIEAPGHSQVPVDHNPEVGDGPFEVPRRLVEALLANRADRIDPVILRRNEIGAIDASISLRADATNQS